MSITKAIGYEVLKNIACDNILECKDLDSTTKPSSVFDQGEIT